MTEHDAIHTRIDNLETTLKSSLSELTEAVKTLVALETEHKATRDTLARYGEKLEKHDARLDVVEQRLPIYDMVVGWGGKVFVAVSIAISLAIIGTVMSI